MQHVARSHLTAPFPPILPMQQVYDLNEYRPGPVLQRIYANLTATAQQGDTQANIVRRSALIVAAKCAWHLSVLVLQHCCGQGLGMVRAMTQSWDDVGGISRPFV